MKKAKAESTIVRPVVESDVNAVVALVHELAAYEQASEQCRLTPAQLRTALFGEEPALFGHVAEVGCEVVAFALWFRNFSTWDGVRGIYRPGRTGARTAWDRLAASGEVERLCP